MALATILIPTFNHGALLKLAARSALAQTIEDLEIFIIGDGATGDTAAAAAELAAADPRVRFFPFPKHARRGEPHRHDLLTRHATGKVVCYLSDRDLWLPDHVATLLTLLESADFAHTLPIRVLPDGTLSGWATDLSIPAERQFHLDGTNRIPLSTAGHTMAMYRRLPHGWRTTPDGVYTDLYMWQQFFAIADCRLVSSGHPTALVFHSFDRHGWLIPQWHMELAGWSTRIADPAWRNQFPFQVLDSVARDRAIQVSEAREIITRLQKEAGGLSQTRLRRLKSAVKQWTGL